MADQTAALPPETVLRLLARLAEAEALASAYWQIIEDAMPHIPGSSFVAEKIAAHLGARGKVYK